MSKLKARPVSKLMSRKDKVKDRPELKSVQVEDLDRAMVAILGTESFMATMGKRSDNLDKTLAKIKEDGLTGPEVDMVLKAKKEFDAYGRFEQPAPGLIIVNARAEFAFEVYDRIGGGYVYRCTKPSKRWAKDQRVGIDMFGRLQMVRSN